MEIQLIIPEPETTPAIWEAELPVLKRVTLPARFGPMTVNSAELLILKTAPQQTIMLTLVISMNWTGLQHLPLPPGSIWNPKLPIIRFWVR